MQAAAPPELAVFCDREYRRLVGALGLYCGDRDLAEDLAQEALVRVCQHWPQVKEMASPGAWAHRVAINLANSHYRRRALHRRVTPLITERGDRHDADVAAGVDVRRALLALRPRYRTAVVLRYYLGHSTRETAGLMGVPEGTVKSLLHRAVGQLRDALGDRVLEEVTDA